MVYLQYHFFLLSCIYVYVFSIHMIKKIVGIGAFFFILFGSVYADSIGETYVINAIDTNTIYVSDIYTSIVPVSIPLSRIISVPGNIEPGIMIHIECAADNAINMRLVTDEEVNAFNVVYEDFLSRVVAYDPAFIDILKQKYEQSPVENYILRALLSSTLTNGDLMSLQYNQPGAYATHSVDELCNQSIDNTLMRWPDRFFLQTMGKDIVAGTKIVSRQERWADERISEPKPVSTWATETGTTSARAWEKVQTNQDIRKNYVKYFNEADKKKAISYATNPDRRPLEYFPATRIIIHHTAGEYAANRKEGESYMRTLQKYHGSTLWRWDIGYHFLIDGAWTVYEWRRGWMQTVGAHVLWHNRWSVWISLMSSGKYSIPMLVSLVELTLYLGKEYGIDVTGKGMFKNPNVTALEEGPTVVAHKELTPLKPDDPEINMNVFRAILKKVKTQNPWLVDALKK